MTPYVPPAPGPMNRVTPLGVVVGTHATADGRVLRVLVLDATGERLVPASEVAL